MSAVIPAVMPEVSPCFCEQCLDASDPWPCMKIINEVMDGIDIRSEAESRRVVLYRETARTDLALLEEVWLTLAKYAERRDLIAVSHGEFGIIRGMLDAAGECGQREEGAVETLEWIREEHARLQKRLTVYERGAVAESDSDRNPKGGDAKQLRAEHESAVAKPIAQEGFR